MQKELQFTLSIIGILIIGGVLLHGMWTIRKSAKKQKRTRLESRNWEPGFDREDPLPGEPPIYDDVGVGKARFKFNSEKESESTEPHKDKKVAISNSEDVHETNTLKNGPKTNDVSITEAPIVSPQNGIIDENSHVDFHALDIKDDELNEVLVNDLVIHETLEPEFAITKDDKTPAMDFGQDLGIKKDEAPVSLDTDEAKVQSESPVYSNVVTQPKPEFTRPAKESADSEDNFGLPPESLLRKEAEEQNLEQEKFVLETNSIENGASKDQDKMIEASSNSHDNDKPSPDFSLNIQDGPELNYTSEEEELPTGVDKELSFAEQAKRFVRRNKKTVAEKIRQEPVVTDKAAADQMRMDFDQSESLKAENADNSAVSEAKEDKPKQANTASAGNSETDVLVLNVRASDENPIQGASLLPMLLTLGFKFGEHDIFHRHVNTNGKGPILFSLTNMFKPGVFDIDNIENFNTYGLSLFMMLPIEGDAQQVFNMMHNAARKLSDEFGCRILDGNKVGVSKQSLQQYVERIREFERKRINK